MDSVTLFFYPAGILLGLFLALRRKKDPAVTYTRLDKVSIGVNLLLIPGYGIFSYIMMLLGMIIYPTASANFPQKLICWLISGLISAVPLYCGAALGLSVAWRRKGLSKQAFFIQFAGIAGILLSIALFCAMELVSAGWINTSLN